MNELFLNLIQYKAFMTDDYLLSMSNLTISPFSVVLEFYLVNSGLIMQIVNKSLKPYDQKTTCRKFVQPSTGKKKVLTC